MQAVLNLIIALFAVFRHWKKFRIPFIAVNPIKKDATEKLPFSNRPSPTLYVKVSNVILVVFETNISRKKSEKILLFFYIVSYYLEITFC